MTRRVLWALHWGLTLTVAAVASLAAALPFTGLAASIAGVITVTGVCFVGYACAPHPGGTR